MPNTPQLAPEDQFPKQAISQSVQVQPVPISPFQGGLFTIGLASVADQVTAWGTNTRRRDQQLREFWPTESYLAGTVATVSFRNAGFDWQINGGTERVNNAVTDMLQRAIAGDKIGWSEFAKRFSQDLLTQDNGAFIELIRDPGMDANSRFKGERAPVIGIANLDSGKCTRTGNIETPVLYEDRDGKLHKMQWYQVIPFSEFPSAIEKMNGVGYSAVTRALRLAQIMRSIAIFKDEEVSGRNIKKINIVGGVGRQQIEDALARTTEKSNNMGNIRYIEHSILASLDPEKSVSLVTVDLASLPEGFNYDQEMQWYISGLALDFGTDYQELAPLPGGNIGSSSQSQTLDKKSSGKGPRNWMDSLTESFKNYGVLPRGCDMIFNDKNQQEEMEKQAVRTKASEEAAIIVNAKIFPPKTVAEALVRRGIFEQKDLDNTDEEWWKLALEAAKSEANGQPVGNRGGNTLAEDVQRQNTGKPKPTSGGRLKKEFEFEDEEESRDTTLLEDIRFLLAKAFGRNKAAPTPNVNVTVHNQPAKTPNVLVKSSTPNVTVNVPKQPAPVVNIKQASNPAPQVTVNVPKQEAPNVTVNVPKQPAPQVTVNNPITVVGPKGPDQVEIEYDGRGKAIGLKAKK